MVELFQPWSSVKNDDMIEKASKSKEAFLREAEKLSEEEAVKLDYLCMLKNRKANLTAVSSKIVDKIINENNFLL